MSKSLGNGIDPLEMIEKYGTDALRLSLIIGSTPGNDLKVYEEKIETYRNFVNKVWNVSRYILMSVGEVRRIENRPEAKTLADEWILGEIDWLIASVKDNLENFRFSAAGEDIYEFTWSKLADWYLEIAKVEGEKDEVLLYVLERLLVLLHPFAPFVTEEIWKSFETGEMLIIKKWPEAVASQKESTKDNFNTIKDIITGIRNIRAEYKIEPKKKVKAVIVSAEKRDLIAAQSEIIKYLGRVEDLEVTDAFARKEGMAAAVLSGAEIYVSLEGIVDLEKEKQNLLKEKENLTIFASNLRKKLGNETFVAKAPANIIETEKEKLSESIEKLEKVEEKLRLM